MLIRIALGLIGAAFFIFILLTGIYHFKWLLFAELLLLIAIKAWFLGFMLLFIAMSELVARVSVRELLLCFSISQRLQRRLDYHQIKQDQLHRLHEYKIQYIDYFSELNRQRLLNANHKQHIRHLAELIQKSLHQQKSTFSTADFNQYRQQLRAYTRQQDLQSLLQLQQHLISF